MLGITGEIIVSLLDKCSSLRNGFSLNLRVYVALEIMVRDFFGEVFNHLSSFVVVHCLIFGIVVPFVIHMSLVVWC